MEFAEVVTDSSGKHLRYAKAIAIQLVCLTCHGLSYQPFTASNSTVPL